MATTKKTTAKKSDVEVDDQAQIPESPRKSVEEVATEIIEGKWGSGRERDVRLIVENYDPLEINKEVAKQLSER